MAPEVAKENSDVISNQTQQQLEAARAALEKETANETSGAAKLAVTNLSEAMATNNRASVSARLKELRNDADYQRLSKPMRAQLDQLQTEVETPTEKVLRLTQEGTGKVMQQVDGLNPVLKTGIYFATIGASMAVISKIYNGIKAFFVGAGKRIAETGKSLKATGTSVVKNMWSGLKLALGIGGALAIGKVGYDALSSKKQSPTETPKQTV